MDDSSKTISNSEDYINSLSPEKRALLELRLNRRALEHPDDRITPRPKGLKSIPLSFAQQRLWFLDQLEPGNSAYNISRAFRLKGTLSIDALNQSLEEIIRRHESLRTSFRVVATIPVQIISPDVKLRLRIVDLERTTQQQDSEVLRLMNEELRQPFDLAQGPLFRGCLLRLAEEEHVLLLAMHHIVSDGWSMGVLHQELTALYKAFCEGRSSPLAELPIQYADFAVWQRDWLQGEVLQEQLKYWKEKLEGSPPTLELPTDYVRPAIQTFRGSKSSIDLSEQLTSALNKLSRQEGVTLFMTLLAAFKILLHRYTGQTDVVVGAPIAGRKWLEIEGLIGFFLNSLVLRTDLSGEPSFRQLLNRVREVNLGAYAHQDIPFEKLLEELHPERNLSQTPLFQVFFNMLTLSGDGLKLPGLSTEALEYSEAESKFDLTVYIAEKDNRLHMTWLYNADLFSDDRMSKIVEQYEYLLNQIVQNPQASISHYSLVTPSAKHLLVDPLQPLQNRWKGAVHSRFSHQAGQFPNQLAVIDPHDTWSYQELEARSNQLAYCLRANGVQNQDVIVVYGHRSASLVWALLGILKAGAAFTILDPAHPASRLIHCFQAVQPRGWLQVEAAEPLPDDLQSFVAALSDCFHLVLPTRAVAEQTDLFQEYPTTAPEISVDQDDLAYIAFTSGSTGHPKGILGRHGPLSHFLPWQAEAFSLSTADRFSMLSGLSHDPLQRDIFTALWVGATLCIPQPDIIGAPGQLAAWMEHHRISFTHLTPPMCQLLTADVSLASHLPSLRYAFFVGDKLTQRDVAHLQNIAPDVTCINSYGTTETQRAVGFHAILPRQKSETEQSKAVYHLGRGMPDVQLLILNSERQLAGFSELGEIYVRSPHLARGYLNDQQLTQERFLTNPFSANPEDRMYRTGDLGRYLPDGNIEFVGRVDWQVKIRGYRIELGEIESVLSQHPDIKDSIVLTQENEQDEPHLVAYIVTNQEAELAVTGLRNYLKEKLPEYMVPSYYVALASFPLTPNGKIDRSKLPRSDRSRLPREEAYVAPQGPVEEMIAQVWQEVLGLSQIGIHDNFFQLGGHSLLATRIVSLLHQDYDITIPLRTLFETSTLAELAVVIEEALLKEMD